MIFPNSKDTVKMARRGAPNEDLSNIEFETSEEVEVVPTFNSMVSIRFNIYESANNFLVAIIQLANFNLMISIAIRRVCGKSIFGQSTHMVSFTSAFMAMNFVCVTSHNLTKFTAFFSFNTAK